MVGASNDLLRVIIVGSSACCVASYGTAKTDIELERLLVCLRAAMRLDLLRASKGI